MLHFIGENYNAYYGAEDDISESIKSIYSNPECIIIFRLILDNGDIRDILINKIEQVDKEHNGLKLSYNNCSIYVARTIRLSCEDTRDNVINKYVGPLVAVIELPREAYLYGDLVKSI